VTKMPDQSLGSPLEGSETALAGMSGTCRSLTAQPRRLRKSVANRFMHEMSVRLAKHQHNSKRFPAAPGCVLFSVHACVRVGLLWAEETILSGERDRNKRKASRVRACATALCKEGVTQGLGDSAPR
jgi:hypothetical protein